MWNIWEFYISNIPYIIFEIDVYRQTDRYNLLLQVKHFLHLLQIQSIYMNRIFIVH